MKLAHVASFSSTGLVDELRVGILAPCPTDLTAFHCTVRSLGNGLPGGA